MVKIASADVLFFQTLHPLFVIFRHQKKKKIKEKTLRFLSRFYTLKIAF